MSYPARVVVTAGRFRDNRPGRVTVEAWNRDGIDLVIHQAGGMDGLPPATTRISLYGQDARGLVAALNDAVAAEHAEADARDQERWSA